MANQPDIIPMAWAANNSTADSIPETTSESGKASWDQGFPVETSLPLSQGGVPPKYGDFNGILKILSQFAVFAQQGGQYAWNNQFTYSVGSIVLGTDGNLYRAAQASTAVNPVGDASGKWSKIADAQSLAATLEQYQSVNTKAWANTVNYSSGAIVTGSDGNLYVALQASGPSTAAVNPVGDVSGTWMRLPMLDDTPDAYARTAFFKNEGSLAFQLENVNVNGTRLWTNYIQSAAYDKYNDIIYAIGELSPSGITAKGSFIAAFDRASGKCLGTNFNPAATNLGAFFGAFPHQGFGVYRPAESAPVQFFCSGSKWLTASSTTEDLTSNNTLNLIAWDYRTPSAFSIARSWQITDGVTYTLDNTIASVSVSDDGTELICIVHNASGHIVFLIWDIATIIAASDGTVLQSLVKKVFYPKQITDTSQGVFLDSERIYSVGYWVTYPHRIQMWDRNGDGTLLGIRPQTCEGLADFPDMIRAEAEGFVFLPRTKGGQNHLMLLIMPAVAALQMPPLFYDLEAPASPAPDRVAYPIYSTNIDDDLPDLNDYTVPGTYYFNAGGKNFPDNSVNGFLVVYRTGYIGESGYSPCRQIFIRIGTGGSTDNIYHRTAAMLSATDNQYYVSSKYISWSDWDVLITANLGIIRRSGLVATGRSDNNNASTLQMNAGENGTATNGAGLYLYANGHSNAGKGRIQGYNSTNGFRYIELDPVTPCVRTSANILPASGNAVSLGTASLDYSHVYVRTGAVETSDERMKQDIASVPEAVLDAWGGIAWKVFRLRDSVAEKGDAARFHSGLVAQDVKKVFEEYGVNPAEYGFFCHDEWEAQPAIIAYDEIKDDDGNVIGVNEIETAPAQEAGDKYGLRYEEALCMEAAYQRRRADRAEARISALERRLDEMEAVLASLVAPIGDETFAGSEEGEVQE